MCIRDRTRAGHSNAFLDIPHLSILSACNSVLSCLRMWQSSVWLKCSNHFIWYWAILSCTLIVVNSSQISTFLLRSDQVSGKDILLAREILFQPLIVGLYYININNTRIKWLICEYNILYHTGSIKPILSLWKSCYFMYLCIYLNISLFK